MPVINTGETFTGLGGKGSGARSFRGNPTTGRVKGDANTNRPGLRGSLKQIRISDTEIDKDLPRKKKVTGKREREKKKDRTTRSWPERVKNGGGSDTVIQTTVNNIVGLREGNSDLFH